jgi:hypothetical protein
MTRRAVSTVLCVVFAIGGSLPVVFSQSSEGIREVMAVRDAFPHRVSTVGFRGGEWALQMDGRWYYWADGRFLPAELRDQAQDFVSIRFYNYQTGPWQPREITASLELRLRERTRQRYNDQRQRFNSFLDTLYQVSTQREADQLMRSVVFLGMRTRVHPNVVEPLQRVERRINNAMLDHQETRAFVRNLSQVHGYHWRNISGTTRRSYHAYGMAVDLVPQRWGGGWGYWQWAADGGVEDWWNIPFEQRWKVPQTVIDAFEAEGFVWGGKWLFFDNVHFEYRPEVLILSRRVRAAG